MELKDNCGICRVSMARDEVKRLLPCRHLLHSKCFESLMAANINADCPICRAGVVDSEVILRKKYKKNNGEDRKRIVACANKGEDWVTLCSSLNINYKTAFHWVRSGRENMLAKGGKRNKTLEDSQIDILVEWMEENSTRTLKELKNMVKAEFDKEISTTTVANYLEGRAFTLKKVHVEFVSMNTEVNKTKRAEFVRSLNEYIQQGKQIIWIDETNFNLFCRRTRGRSRAGTRAVQLLPSSRGPNIHLIAAISAERVISIERRRGSFTAQACSSWIETILQQWQELGNRLIDLVIVCDNAPCHSKLERIIQDIQNNGTATLLRLGPYSPMLNPVETIWSKIKSFVKGNLGIPNVSAPGVIEQRLLYLEGVIDQAKVIITGGDCARAAQHSTTYHAAALSLLDMQVGQ